MFDKKIGNTERNNNPQEAVEEELEVSSRNFAKACRNIIRQASEEAVKEQLSDKVEALGSNLDRLNTEVSEIRQHLSDKLPAMTGLDELHQQHARLLDGFFSDQVEHLFRGIIPVLDRVEARLIVLKRKSYNPDPSVADVKELVNFVKGIRIELLSLLSTIGIEPYRTGGEDFSGEHHQAVKFVSTNNAELEGRIARHLKPGYRRNGTVIRPEIVEVYRYDNSNNGKEL